MAQTESALTNPEADLIREPRVTAVVEGAAKAHEALPHEHRTVVPVDI